jgi:hypothetical protein
VARRGLDWWRLDRGSHRRLDCLSRAWLHRRSVGGTADDQRLLSRSLSRDREQREGKIQITFRTPPAQATSGAPRGSVIFQNSFLPLGCTNECRPALTISKHGAKPIGSLFASGVRRVRGGLSYGHRDLNLEGTAGIQARGGARTQAHRCRQVRGRAMPSCDRTWWRWRAGCAASVRRAGSDHCAMLPRTWRNAATSTSRAGHSRQRRCDRCWCARTSGARTLFWEAYGKLRDELATRGDRGLRPAPGAATTAT